MGSTPDTTPPAAPVITSGTSTNSLTPTIIGTAEANSTITLTINSNTYNATTAVSNGWSVYVSNALAAGQSYPVSVTATDAANNVSTTTNMTLSVSADAGTFAGTKVAIIGDSLTWQGGPGETNVPASFTAAGWPTTAPSINNPTIGTWFYGWDGKPINDSDSGNRTTVQTIAMCCASAFSEPDVWVIALGTNSGGDPITKIKADMQLIFNALGPSAKLLWVNMDAQAAGPSYPSINQAMAETVAGRPYTLLGDWNQFMTDHPDQTGWWTDGVHMATLGYSYRNNFIAQNPLRFTLSRCGRMICTLVSLRPIINI